MRNATERDEAYDRGTPSARFAVRSPKARAALAVGAFVAYALAYLPLRLQAGIAAGLLSIVPVALTGWTLGLRGGLLAGLAVPPLHTLLMNLAGYPGWDVILRETNGLGPLAAISVGVGVGYWSDLTRSLQQQIAERVRAEQQREHLIVELQAALAEVRTLRGMLPMCASCKKIRDDGGYWHDVEVYIEEHSEVEFSHGVCPDCARRLYPEFYEEEQ